MDEDEIVSFQCKLIFYIEFNCFTGITSYSQYSEDEHDE